MSAPKPVPTIVLGGSGYVAGEFLRLLHAHPGLSLGGVVSSSQAGEAVAKTFPHLAPAFPNHTFVSLEAMIERLGTAPKWLVLSAAPHGASAGLIDKLLTAGATAGVEIVVVDASADFRFPEAEAWAAVYGHPHATPQRLAEFTCAVPEQLKSVDTPHVAHPGCFATTMLLPIVPLVALGAADEFFVSAVTGSTGAGRTPRDTTHHPLRQSNMFAYQALKHRHEPEVRSLIKAATGRDVALNFVPHSGPFARGIHATIFLKPKERLTAAQINDALREYYRGSEFVRVEAEPPKMKDIVATNYAAMHAVANNDTIAVFSVTDNLLKGAAGGSLQWANRLLGMPETMGLTAPAAGWL
ncbi:MAG TPA: N-acetyl-gamma-glutamyl-phosphate reductase [Gammaproteobacteria bacterium]|jgi:N-acetyl-gamma-glutamyl-phosphate reductase|nr:N-acetyl-gamma-glutamyl-phosphate reductase [Gammaproteobacteria bacterium]